MNDLVATPYFAYDDKATINVLADFKKLAKTGIEIFYAVKANHYEKLIKRVIEFGFGFDVASINEIKHVLKLGADSRKIVFAAPAKKLSDIEEAKKLGVTVFMADSEFGVKNIAQVFGNEEHTIVLRMQGHGSNAVFDLSDKFGLNHDEALRILRMSQDKKFQIKGITFHVGSQNLDIDAWNNAYDRIHELAKLFKETGHSLEIIDFGGGVPAAYDGKVLKRQLYLKVLVQLAKKITKHFPNVRIAIEPGRAIAAETMTLYTQVVDVKEYKKPTVLIVDTSVFSGLVEAIYGLNYPIELIRKSRVPLKPYTIGGITCDGCDVIYKSILLPGDVCIGDILKISYAGSYTASWEQVHLLSWPKIV